MEEEPAQQPQSTQRIASPRSIPPTYVRTRPHSITSTRGHMHVHSHMLRSCSPATPNEPRALSSNERDAVYNRGAVRDEFDEPGYSMVRAGVSLCVWGRDWEGGGGVGVGLSGVSIYSSSMYVTRRSQAPRTQRNLQCGA